MHAGNFETEINFINKFETDGENDVVVVKVKALTAADVAYQNEIRYAC